MEGCEKTRARICCLSPNTFSNTLRSSSWSPLAKSSYHEHEILKVPLRSRDGVVKTTAFLCSVTFSIIALRIQFATALHHSLRLTFPIF
ncbi:hypothetical protein NPIL_477621 [Nephila pilipes]|uniref:Uncharacterized protein n=1 Tax=Nephila pilipes TaxID=299642 RepID=A0A8X6U682_NEPPI|nr:hypothetical protein NPIL_477621 [Nephila pilipes]